MLIILVYCKDLQLFEIHCYIFSSNNDNIFVLLSSNNINQTQHIIFDINLLLIKATRLLLAGLDYDSVGLWASDNVRPQC